MRSTQAPRARTPRRRRRRHGLCATSARGGAPRRGRPRRPRRRTGSRQRCRTRRRAGNGGAGRATAPRPREHTTPLQSVPAVRRQPTRGLYGRPQMRSRVVWRRAATAFGIYGSALLGVLASIVASRELTKLDFSRFALVFAVTGLLQQFLDLTVEEVVVKFGNRYIARGDWGRFHRLLRVAFLVK